MKSRSMENTNHIFGTGSGKESDVANTFPSALDGSRQELNYNDCSLKIDWNDQYLISNNEVSTPFFFENTGELQGRLAHILQKQRQIQAPLPVSRVEQPITAGIPITVTMLHQAKAQLQPTGPEAGLLGE
ncbi:hypothetical protein PENARI_c028G11951 [Penicillium arizonense]|uniref:Uncharacterized protein n=1 Tax=Penicillium arizonense TaxID=1835702 RepID=A0A1F5L5F3_PENAI|nr:hypothetical protein PENARI_c028G11951 [Penicillium arizonense]OGE48453.1 hypothetical protein PENARI_c028G11951 [Penicillium arizonense]